MSLVRVYRVEDANLHGMYSIAPCGEGSYAELAGLNCWASDRHPMPYNDSLYNENFHAVGGPTDEYVFGFESLDQLTSWLYRDSVRAGLQEQGLRISVYELPEDWVIRGYTQLTFCADPDRSGLKLLHKLNVLTFEVDDEQERTSCVPDRPSALRSCPSGAMSRLDSRTARSVGDAGFDEFAGVGARAADALISSLLLGAGIKESGTVTGRLSYPSNGRGRRYSEFQRPGEGVAPGASAAKRSDS